MKLQQFRYFVETVNCGSINRAAERLLVAQPSLSNALRDLETEIGHVLFTRTSKGILLTADGEEFLCYARRVLNQVDLLEQRWLSKKLSRQVYSVSTQHYAFVKTAFANMVKKTDAEEYTYTLREARISEIIEDVKDLRSKVGVLCIDSFNRHAVESSLNKNKLAFHALFTANPHILMSHTNPLAKKEYVKLEDLTDYPRLSFEQDGVDSSSNSKEPLSGECARKDIYVGDRATILNLMIELNGYMISTERVDTDLNGGNITAVPLHVDGTIQVGWISHEDMQLTPQAVLFLKELNAAIAEHGAKIQR